MILSVLLGVIGSSYCYIVNGALYKIGNLLPERENGKYDAKKPLCISTDFDRFHFLYMASAHSWLHSRPVNFEYQLLSLDGSVQSTGQSVAHWSSATLPEGCHLPLRLLSSDTVISLDLDLVAVSPSSVNGISTRDVRNGVVDSLLAVRIPTKKRG